MVAGEAIVPRLTRSPKGSFFLFGARGVGKSTWTRATFPHMLLRAYGEVHPLFDEIAYWAPAEARSVEVDFILQRAGEHLALEVKAGTRLAPSELAGLRAITGLPKLVRRVLVYNGQRAQRTQDGIEVWPLGRFLDALAGQALWP